MKLVDETDRLKHLVVDMNIESFYSGDTSIDFDDAKVSEDSSLSIGLYKDRTEVCRQLVSS